MRATLLALLVLTLPVFGLWLVNRFFTWLIDYGRGLERRKLSAQKELEPKTRKWASRMPYKASRTELRG